MTAVDRLLNAHAHRSAAFADYLLTELVRPSLRAFAPAVGVDVVALARHAAAAHRRRLRTQVLLGLLLICIGTILAWGIATANLPQTVVLLTVAVLAAFAAVGVDEFATVRAMRGSVAGPPLGPAVEQPLLELIDSNVVVFAGDDPFAAWGSVVKGWRIEIDVSRSPPASRGTGGVPAPLSPSELQTALLRAAEDAGMDSRHRMFVAGSSAGSVPGLVPDPGGRPACRIDPDLVRQAIERPLPGTGTYLCIERSLPDREIRVSEFVRARMTGSHLSIESHARALIPSGNAVGAAARLPRDRLEMVIFVASATLRRTPRRLVSGPIAVLRELVRYVGRRRRLARARRLVSRGRPIDRGAQGSIRAAFDQSSAAGPLVRADVARTMAEINDLILRTVVDVLGSHGVDTTDLRPPEENRINQLHAHEVVFGDLFVPPDLFDLQPAGAPAPAMPEPAGSPVRRTAPKPAGSVSPDPVAHAAGRAAPNPAPGRGGDPAWRGRLERLLLLPLTGRGARIVAIHHYEGRMARLMNSLGDPGERD